MCLILHPLHLGEPICLGRYVYAMGWVQWIETKLSYAKQEHVEEDNRKNELWAPNENEEENVPQDGGYWMFLEVYIAKPFPY